VSYNPSTFCSYQNTNIVRQQTPKDLQEAERPESGGFVVPEKTLWAQNAASCAAT
jgi:hypothetical protein